MGSGTLNPSERKGWGDSATGCYWGRCVTGISGAYPSRCRAMFDTVHSFHTWRTELLSVPLNGWLDWDAWNYLARPPPRWWSQDDEPHWSAIYHTSEQAGNGLATRPAHLSQTPHW